MGEMGEVTREVVYDHAKHARVRTGLVGTKDGNLAVLVYPCGPGPDPCELARMSKAERKIKLREYPEMPPEMYKKLKIAISVSSKELNKAAELKEAADAGVPGLDAEAHAGLDNRDE